MHTVKLYRLNEEQFVVDVDYRLMGETLTNFWGELAPQNAHVLLMMRIT